MSNFEKLVMEMREAQEAYNKDPSGDNLIKVESLEFDVDKHLKFVSECKASTYSETKKYLNEMEA